MLRDNIYQKNVSGSVLIEFLIALPILLLLFGVSSVFFSIYKEKAVLREAARLGVAATQYVEDVDPWMSDHHYAANVSQRSIDNDYLDQLRNLSISVAYNNILGQGLDPNNYTYNVNFVWDNTAAAVDDTHHWRFNGYNTSNQNRLYINLVITTPRNLLTGLFTFVGLGRVAAASENAILPIQNAIAADDSRLTALRLGQLGGARGL